MGSNKALLPYRGSTLVQHAAEAVRQAAGSVALIGDPAAFRALDYAVYPDRWPGCGPLGGVFTALSVSQHEWSLVVACDMPGISADALKTLIGRAAGSRARVVAGAEPGGDPEPLCAVYHCGCLPELARAIRDKRLKMRDLLLELGVDVQPLDHPALVNVNTPAEWAAFGQGQE